MLGRLKLNMSAFSDAAITDDHISSRCPPNCGGVIKNILRTALDADGGRCPEVGDGDVAEEKDVRLSGVVDDAEMDEVGAIIEACGLPFKGHAEPILRNFVLHEMRLAIQDIQIVPKGGEKRRGEGGTGVRQSAIFEVALAVAAVK